MSSSSSDPDISLDETDVSGNEPSLAVRDPNSADRQLWTTFGPTSSNPLDPLHSRKPPRAAANRAILQDDPYAKGRITVTATPAVTIVQGQVDVGDDNSASVRSWTPLKNVGVGSYSEVQLCDWHSPLPPNTPLSPMQCGAGARPEWAGKRLVALKRMKKRWERGWAECKHLKELESLRKIPSHPNIIPLYDAFILPDTKFFCLVFESMEGNLYQLIKSRRGRPFAGGLVASIYRQAVSGVAHIHASGYFHRDMKPENLLVTTTGLADYSPTSPQPASLAPPERDVMVIVKLADFGLVRETNSEPPYTEYVSVRWYRAPEMLLRSTNYSNPVDMWALGTVLAELINLKPIFPGKNEVDQVAKITAILGDPSDRYGVDARGRIVGGGEWSKGIKMASEVGFIFKPTPPVPFGSLFDLDVPTSLVDCIADLLRYDPDLRLTAQQCKEHSYWKETQQSQLQVIASNNADLQTIQNRHTKSSNYSITPLNANASFENSKSSLKGAISEPGAQQMHVPSVPGLSQPSHPSSVPPQFTFNTPSLHRHPSQELLQPTRPHQYQSGGKFGFGSVFGKKKGMKSIFGGGSNDVLESTTVELQGSLAAAPSNNPAPLDPKLQKKMMEKARKEAEIAKREHQIRAMRERSQAFIRKRDYELRETERASAREMEWRSSDKGGQDEANLDQKGKYGDMAKLSLNLPRAADLPHSYGHLYPYPSDFHRQLKHDSWKKPRDTDDDYSMISNDTQSVSGLSMATFSTMETDPGVFGTQEMMGAKRDHHETSTFNPRTVNAGPSGRFPTARSSTNSEQKFAQHGLDDGNETIKSPPMYGLGGSVNPMFQAPPNPSTLNSRNVGEGIRGHTLPPFSHFASVAEQPPSYISRSPFPELSQAPESQIKGLFPPTSLSTSLNPIIGTGPNRTMSQRQMRNNPMDLDLDLNTPESPDEIVASIESIANSLTVFQQSALDIAEQASLRLCAFEAWNDVAEQDENILLNLSFDSLDSEYNAHQKLLESRLRQTTMLEALYGHLDTVKQLFQLLEDDTLINDVSTELLTAAVVVAWMIITGEEELEKALDKDEQSKANSVFVRAVVLDIREIKRGKGKKQVDAGDGQIMFDEICTQLYEWFLRGSSNTLEAESSMQDLVNIANDRFPLWEDIRAALESPHRL